MVSYIVTVRGGLIIPDYTEYEIQAFSWEDAEDTFIEKYPELEIVNIRLK